MLKLQKSDDFIFKIFKIVLNTFKLKINEKKPIFSKKPFY